MRLTHEIIHSAGTYGMGFNHQQLNVLGVAWPPRKGWLSKLIGTEIPDEKWQLVMRLKSVKNRKMRKEIMHNHQQATLPAPLPEFNERIGRPTMEHLHDYLCYQYPACRGDISLEALCQQIKKLGCNNQA